MILAGNQIEQRGLLHIYLENQDGIRHQRQSFLVTYVSKVCMIVTAIGAYIIVVISRPDNMQLHELILTQILIC